MNDERRCFASSFIVHGSSFRVGGDEGSRTLIIRFTRPTLCYPVELHRHENWWTGRDSNPRRKFAGLLCCRYITSPEYLSFVICGCALPLVRPICCWRASN